MIGDSFFFFLCFGLYDLVMLIIVKNLLLVLFMTQAFIIVIKILRVTTEQFISACVVFWGVPLRLPSSVIQFKGVISQ